MSDVFEKQDDATLKVTTSITKDDIVLYDYDFLKNQLINIQADIDRNMAELQKVKDLLAQADSLGITSKEIK